MIAFWVDGVPISQGSKRPGRNVHTGKAMIREDPLTLKRWRALIHAKASLAADGQKRILAGTGRKRRHVVYDSPVIVWAEFVFPLVKGHGRWNGVKGTRPDLDKLNRAVGDSLESAGIVSEDSRIVGWPCAPAKVYGEFPGVRILVETWEEFRERGLERGF